MSYKYLRCRKDNGLLISTTFEENPSNLKHTIVFWVKVEDDGNGNFVLPESPTSKNDSVNFVPSPVLNQSELDGTGLIKDNGDGSWTHNLDTAGDLSAMITKVKKKIKKQARNIIRSSDRKVVRHRDQVDGGIAEENRTLSDTEYQDLLTERELARSESKTFRNAVGSKSTLQEAIDYTWTFTSQEHGE